MYQGKKVLFGSKAAKHWFNDFRKTADTDYLIDGYYLCGEGIEYYNCNIGPGYQRIFNTAGDGEPLPAVTLYTIKLAHCFWPIHWPKTMHDILFFQEKGLQYDEALFIMLYKDCEKLHGKKQAYLKKDNEDFFQDGVKRQYVHDDIHRAIAYYDEPMFEKVKQDRTKAYINYDLFCELPHEDKLKLCREEIYVTALERFLIPNDFFNIAPVVAYRGACRLLLTSMTKGWFPKFIATHWRELHKPDTHNFIALFQEKLQ